MDGQRALAKLKASKKTSDILVMMVTALKSVNNRYAGAHQKLKIYEQESNKSIAGRG